jgi:RNA polymerase sigma-70 factor (ECF subfamily)
VSAVAPVLTEPRLQPQPAEATGVLYERYSGRIFGYCLGLLGSREDAEDAVQTTFLNAQRGLRRGVVPEFELAWLFKIAQNVCRTRHASAGRRGRLESVRDLDSLQDVLATPERTASVSARELTCALAGIPERQRRALLLREWCGLSYEEIAIELDLSVSAVETLLFRARRSVAEQLEQTGARQRGSAVASVFAAFRWLFQGGAVPVKFAAAVAVVATTATAVTVPLARHEARAPAPAPQSSQVDVFRADARGKERAQRAVSSGTRPAPSRSDVVPAKAQSPAPLAGAGMNGLNGASPSATTPSPSASVPPTAVQPPPSIKPPDLPAPVVTVPSVSVPDLPPIPSLPSVELPVESPPLPPLPLPDTPTLP